MSVSIDEAPNDVMDPLLPIWYRRRASRPQPAQPAPVVLEGGLDLPSHGGNVFDTLEVSGWAFSQVGAIEQIKIYLSDRFLGDATYGWLRPDVVAARPHIHDRACGFHTKLKHDLNGEADVDALLRVDIVDSAGNHLRFERPVDTRRPTPQQLAESRQPVEIDVEQLMARVKQEIKQSEATEACPAP